MERIGTLSRYQKGLIALLAVMAVVFTPVYFWVAGRTGYLYENKIFVPSRTEEGMRYCGKLAGQESCFLVTEDGRVTFTLGETVYGPYTVREVPEAIPGEDPLADQMTGVEVLDEKSVLFRGGALRMGGEDPYWMLVREDGGNYGLTITVTMQDGTVMDMDGNVIDPHAPNVSTILDLVSGPKLTSKGLWIALIGGFFLSGITVVSILYADELLRWSLSFRIRNAADAEPSDWEIAQRYVGWTILVGMVLVLYILGLL